jgi:drug/metabolite transporter (DMT)-like permease
VAGPTLHPVIRGREGRAVLALVAASFLFGATFVVVKSALDDIPPFGFIGWRFLIGALVLAALGIPRGREIWVHGSICGLALFAGYSLQTSGLQYTTASASALITGLYVVITPFLVAVVTRRLPRALVMLGAFLAFLGVALLTGIDGFSVGAGEWLTMGCALAFACHIVLLSHYAHRHPVIPFTMVQVALTAVLSFVAALFVEGGITFPERSVWAALAVTGIGVTAGAFVLQIWAQTVVGASTAAVVLAAEPAFGVLAGWVVLGERLDIAGWIGAVLILVAIYLVVTKQRDQASRDAEAVSLAH